MAIPQGYVGIRSYLRGKGIPDSQIGWDDTNKHITVYGQKYHKPSMNVEGTTYARPEDLPDVTSFLPPLPKPATTPTPTGGSALGGAPLTTPKDAAGGTSALGGGAPLTAPKDQTAPPPGALPPPSATPSTATPAAPTVQPIPISPQLQALFDRFTTSVNQAPVTAQDIMNSPEWKANQQVLDLQKGESQAGLRRSLASRNMLRSTPAVQALAGEDARYEAARASALPQMLNSESARRQQNIANIASLLTQAAGLESQSFSQGVAKFTAETPYTTLTAGQQEQKRQYEETFPITEAGVTGTYKGQPTMDAKVTDANMTGTWDGKPTFNRSVTEAGMTGKYQPQEAADAINAILKAKEGYDRNPTQARADADAARAILPQYNIDPALFGADVTLEQARKNAAGLGWTQAGRANEAGITGIDPVTGQETPDAKVKRFQAEREQINLDIAKLDQRIKADPTYGATAESKVRMDGLKKDLAAKDADIANVYSTIRSRDAETAKPKKVEYTAPYITQRWGATDLGMTTNYENFDKQMTDISSNIQQGGASLQDVDEWIEGNWRTLAAMGVDPNALKNAAHGRFSPKAGSGR